MKKIKGWVGGRGTSSSNGAVIRSAPRRQIRPLAGDPHQPSAVLELGIVVDEPCWRLDHVGPPRANRVWRAIERWSRTAAPGPTVGAADVHRVIRRDAKVVAAAVRGWTERTLSTAGASLQLRGGGGLDLNGRLRIASRRTFDVTVSFAPWSGSHLDAHLRPTGRSARHPGSPRWWAAAHGLLDALEAELTKRIDGSENRPDRAPVPFDSVPAGQ